MDSLKRIYWKINSEYKIWEMHFMSLFPGRVGQALRRCYIPKRIGSCGKNLIMAHNVKISSPEKLFLGDYVGVGVGAYFTAGGGIYIGNYVGIGPDVKIWSSNHIYKDPHTPWRYQGSELKPVHIGNDVWIAAGSIIKPGISIGDGAIIGAGTVLSKSIPPYAIVSGNPGRVVGWRLQPD